ncbi:hypothetical protein [Acidocella aquatica]|uniref:hypothetical protein n=1 Tax=Acidocella aquatica TaxID=1922313 RepID=UPI0024E18516|nr:hypothetical protein [Acidocella aquatica]
MTAPQAPVYVIALTNPLWVRAYLPETELGRIRPRAGGHPGQLPRKPQPHHAAATVHRHGNPRGHQSGCGGLAVPQALGLECDRLRFAQPSEPKA